VIKLIIVFLLLSSPDQTVIGLTFDALNWRGDTPDLHRLRAQQREAVHHE